MQEYTPKEAKIKIRNLLRYIDKLSCNIKVVFDGIEEIEFLGYMRNNREINGDSFCTIICETYWKYQENIYVIKNIKEYTYSYEDKKGIEYGYNEDKLEYLESKITKSHMQSKPIEYYDQLFDLFHGFKLERPSPNLIANPSISKIIDFSNNKFITFFVENITDLLSSSIHDININQIFINLEVFYGKNEIHDIMKNIHDYILETDLRNIFSYYLYNN